MALQAALRHRDLIASLDRAAVEGVRRLWARVDPHALDATWRPLVPRAYSVVAGAQLAAARAADAYVTDVLSAQGVDFAASAAVEPRAFAGFGYPVHGGRPVDLPQLLASAVNSVKGATLEGEDIARAMARGEAFLARVASLQVNDAGRSAVGSAIVARPEVTGYVRQVSAGACSRCIILAGKFYRWNEGFKRHPYCRCVHIPARENVEGDVLTDPRAFFDSLSREEQDRRFTAAGAQAIRDGASMSRVVNARSGIYTTADGGRATLAGRTFVAGDRLLPETIYARATTRAAALEGLRRHGYLL